MKKFKGINFALTISLSIAVLALSGCASAPAGTDAQAATQGEASSAPGANPRNGTGAGPAQARRAAADITGAIESINGNDVVLKLIQMPEFGRGGPGGNPQGSRPNGGSGTLPTKPSGSNPPSGDNATPGRNNGNGQGGGSQQFTYTGETKTVTIPDSITIASRFQGGGNGSGSDGQAAMTIKDLKAGDILQIWYSDDNSQTVSEVSVMRQAANSGSAPGSGDSANTGTGAT